ncbi:hypothetical protein CROQUDRAFT_714569 [Cronartium quercuum f. sp. fusiforme G11]|uniref:Secreted protein n=1 Tax=Cronartium quercuum f. sp. fusiforme G11 TaxID=708437 RepID=A0A9P6NJQ9_9BASI|nr:hypothetical protein CROQUDRAFT_714569 [Cronartium quercuum f. sp. fusiforme G11]
MNTLYITPNSHFVSPLSGFIHHQFSFILIFKEMNNLLYTLVFSSFFFFVSSSPSPAKPAIITGNYGVFCTSGADYVTDSSYTKYGPLNSLLACKAATTIGRRAASLYICPQKYCTHAVATGCGNYNDADMQDTTEPDPKKPETFMCSYAYSVNVRPPDDNKPIPPVDDAGIACRVEGQSRRVSCNQQVKWGHCYKCSWIGDFKT